MAMLLCPQFTRPSQDNPFLSDDLGIYMHAQPMFGSDEASAKLPLSNNGDMDGLFANASSGLLSDWASFPDFISDSSLDFQPDLVCSPESISPYSSNPSSPSTSLKEQELEDLFEVLDGDHPNSKLTTYSPSAKPSLDPHFYTGFDQPYMSTFFSEEAVFPSPGNSPTSSLSPSPTPPPFNSSVEKESPVLTSLLGKRPTACDSQNAQKMVPSKQQRIRKKLPYTVMKQRKKEQNKDAALRYRQRKKEQQELLDQKCQVLQEKNTILKGQVSDLSREIAYLKKLWQEVTDSKHKSRLP